MGGFPVVPRLVSSIVSSIVSLIVFVAAACADACVAACVAACGGLTTSFGGRCGGLWRTGEGWIRPK